jgi:uncharacterized protein
MAEHPNAALIRSAFTAMAQGEMGPVNSLFADDIVWHAPGHSLLAGVTRGREALFAKMGGMAATAQTLKQDLHAILADDDHAVCLIDLTMARESKQVELQQILTFHMAGSKVTEGWVTFTDLYAADDFWA